MNLPVITSICVISTLLLMTYIYLKRKFSYWDRRGVPHIQSTSFIFGNLKEIFMKKKTLIKLYQEIYQKFDGRPYCGLYEFQSPVLMVRDPDLIQQVLVENFHCFQNCKAAVGDTFDEILPFNPFVQNGCRWKYSRHIVSSALTPNKLRCLDKFMKTISQELFTFIEDSPGDVEVFDIASRFCCEMVSNFGWGIEGNSFSRNSTVNTIFCQSQYISTSTNIMLVFLYPALNSLLNLRCFPKELSAFLKYITKQATDATENLKTNQNTFLHSLLQMRKKRQENGKDLTMDEITGHMGTLFLDGYETTARVLSYMIYNLMLYPDVQQKIRNEILNLSEITVESVGKLEYMNKFISEMFRYHSLISFLGRICSEKCKLGDLDIEAGTAIIIPLSGINHDPNYYPEPDVFNPDNFSDENKNNRHKFIHSTFGHGPRMCLGVRYANATIKLFLSYILKNYEIVPPENNSSKSMKPGPHSIFLYIQDELLYVKFIKKHLKKC